MQILHVIRSMRTRAGGPAFALRQMAASLEQASAHSVIACCEAEDGDVTPGGQSPTAPFFIFHGGSPVELLRPAPQRLRDLVARADIVHLHGIWDSILIVAAREARKLGKPLVISPHGMLSPWSMGRHRFRKLPYYRLFTKPMLHGAAAIHFDTETEAGLAASRLPRGVPHFIAPILPAEEFYQDPPGYCQMLWMAAIRRRIF